MDNPHVATLFASVVHETRRDLEEVASRFLGRVTGLTAHASGALAGGVDRLGERVSATVEDVAFRVSTRVGDRVVELGEKLTGAAKDDAAGESPEC